MDIDYAQGLWAASAETLKVRTFLRTIKEGEVATDAELAKIATKPWQVRSAIAGLVREKIIFYRVRKIGWKRASLTTDEVASSESITPQRVSRMVRRSLRRLSAVKYDALSNEDKMQFNQTATKNSTLAFFSNAKTRDKIDNMVIGNGSQIETRKLLDLFSKDKGGV